MRRFRTIEKLLNNKKILITGGTGTIGTYLTKHILDNYSPKVVRILSRDETKQHLLRSELREYDKILRFFIGNIRDKERTARAMKDIDIVFHLAALKYVTSCEYNAFETIKTNVIGLQNLIELSMDNNIEKFVFTSSDKAATPCNIMGVTKLMGEKLVTAANYYRGFKQTIFYSVRFGNVIGTRGSIVPLIDNRVKNDLPIDLTHKNMTRYIMDIDSSIKLLLNTLKITQGGEVFIMKMECVKIIDLINVLITYFAKKYNKDVRRIQINEIGTFIGEKLYEELFSIEESERCYETDEMYIILPQAVEKEIDLININVSKYPNIKKFNINKPFNSKVETYLTKNEIKEFINNII